MKESVKEYIISRVFIYCNDLHVKESRHKDGFIFGMPVIIPSGVFDSIYANRAYFARHHVAWYVGTDFFPGIDYQIPCIHFYDDVDD